MWVRPPPASPAALFLGAAVRERGHSQPLDVEVVFFGLLGELLAAAAKEDFLRAVVDSDRAFETGGEGQRGAHLVFAVVVGVEGNDLRLAAGPSDLVG